MHTILNLTQHQATSEQIADGVVEPASKQEVQDLLTIPVAPNILTEQKILDPVMEAVKRDHDEAQREGVAPGMSAVTRQVLGDAAVAHGAEAVRVTLRNAVAMGRVTQGEFDALMQFDAPLKTSPRSFSDPTIVMIGRFTPSPLQAAQGAIVLPDDVKRDVVELMEFSKEDLQLPPADLSKLRTARAEAIADTVSQWIHTRELQQQKNMSVMVSGSPFLASTLERALLERGLLPVYSQTARVDVTEQHVAQPDGTTKVVKTAPFQHERFLPCLPPPDKQMEWERAGGARWLERDPDIATLHQSITQRADALAKIAKDQFPHGVEAAMIGTALYAMGAQERALEQAGITALCAATESTRVPEPGKPDVFRTEFKHLGFIVQPNKEIEEFQQHERNSHQEMLTEWWEFGDDETEVTRNAGFSWDNPLYFLQNSNFEPGFRIRHVSHYGTRVDAPEFMPGLMFSETQAIFAIGGTKLWRQLREENCGLTRSPILDILLTKPQQGDVHVADAIMVGRAKDHLERMEADPQKYWDTFWKQEFGVTREQAHQASDTAKEVEEAFKYALDVFEHPFTGVLLARAADKVYYTTQPVFNLMQDKLNPQVPGGPHIEYTGFCGRYMNLYPFIAALKQEAPTQTRPAPEVKPSTSPKIC